MSRPAATPPSDRPSAPEGREIAQPFNGGRRPRDRMDAHHGERVARWGETRRRGGFRHGPLVQHEVASRSLALGLDPRLTRGVRDAGSFMHRHRRRSRADHLVAREEMANGNHLPRGAPAPGPRNAEALVRASHPRDRPGDARARFLKSARSYLSSIDVTR